MVFSDDEDENGKTAWFNKRERFKDVFMGMKAWDMVSNFGFRTLPNGKIEVYHTGEYFTSYLPIFGGIVYYVFKMHSMWLAWATSHYLRYQAFRAETEAEEEIEHMSRTDMPLYLLSIVFPYEIKAFCYRLAAARFNLFLSSAALRALDPGPSPCKKDEPKKVQADDDDDEEGDDDDDDDGEKKGNEDDDEPGDDEQHEVHLQKIMTQVKQDIEADKKYVKEVAIRRMETLRVNPNAEFDDEIDLETDTLGKNQGGPAVWEALKRTNDAEAYLKATRAAVQRRNTRAARLGRQNTMILSRQSIRRASRRLSAGGMNARAPPSYPTTTNNNDSNNKEGGDKAEKIESPPASAEKADNQPSDDATPDNGAAKCESPPSNATAGEGDAKAESAPSSDAAPGDGHDGVAKCESPASNATAEEVDAKAENPPSGDAAPDGGAAQCESPAGNAASEVAAENAPQQ